MRLDHQKGRYRVRTALTEADLVACQTLRHRCFFGRAGCDADAFDATWTHLMVEDCANGALVCTLRYTMSRGSGLLDGYTAGFYDLQPLADRGGSTLEIGRFCCDPAVLDPHILRVAWGALTRIVDSAGIETIFGCASFAGTDPAPYADVLGDLFARHGGPETLRPRKKGYPVRQIDDVPCGQLVAQSPMPPLLRTYLAMGGWVSDHAVVDDYMQTLHVFAALEVTQVPAARAKALRALG